MVNLYVYIIRAMAHNLENSNSKYQYRFGLDCGINTRNFLIAKYAYASDLQICIVQISQLK
jgi:hypothetical protein